MGNDDDVYLLIPMIYLDKLEGVLAGHDQLLIIPHNDPDPDAIAASVGFRFLVSEKFGIDSRIRYNGIIGRAENKALVRYLGQPLRKLNRKELESSIPIALIDTQPGAGNHPIPEGASVIIVIDHHTLQESQNFSLFSDIRPGIGASSTIITGFLREAEINIPSPLATALFYGIKTDTMGLGRGASPNDVSAYFFLHPQIDIDGLVKIERAQVPSIYFQSLASALQSAQLFDDDLIISYIGKMNYPDLGAEIADLLLRLQGVKWVICMGEFQNDFILSIRSQSSKIGAGDIVQNIVGELGSAGGHGTMAGGQIRLDNQIPFLLFSQLTQKALEFIKNDVSLSSDFLI